MKNVAFTMVQNDLVMLDLWLKYYSHWFDDLHVIGLDTKDVEGIKKLQQKYHFQFENWEHLEDRGMQSAEALISGIKEQQVKFFDTKKYKWVLFSNLDEFVTTDPRYWGSFKKFLQNEQADVVYCEAYNILQEEDEGPIDYSKPYLMQRKYWAKEVHYNKPLLAQRPLQWEPGCHKEEPLSGEESKAIHDTGLLLLHLKHAELRDFDPIKGGNSAACKEENKQLKELIPPIIRKIF